MGLSPSFKDRKATRPFDAERRASLMVAAALFVATASPIPSVALTKQDVTEIVTASEKRQADTFVLVPIASAGITAVGMVLSSIRLDDKIAQSNNKLDDTIARFSEQKDVIKKDLQSGTEEKARNAAFLGTLVAIFLTCSATAYVFAAASAIKSP